MSSRLEISNQIRRIIYNPQRITVLTTPPELGNWIKYNLWSQLGTTLHFCNNELCFCPQFTIQQQ